MVRTPSYYPDAIGHVHLAIQARPHSPRSGALPRELLVLEKRGTSELGHVFQGESMTRQLSHVLMTRPEYFSILEAKNPFSRSGCCIDLPLALEQWENLRLAFRRVGLEVFLMEPRAGLEDMCFTATQAFVGLDREDRSFAIPSRLLHSSRREEIEHFERWYSGQGYRIIDLELNGEEFLEGSGDLLWSPDWETVWAGFGNRSTSIAVNEFAAVMDSMGFGVRQLELVDPHFYHLNLCLAPLTPESLLIYPGAFAPETLARIRNWARTFEVTRDEALQFVCNGVAVNGYYITSWINRRVRQILEKLGLETIVVELSEFQKAGGSVASLKMLLP
jgi:N-dimethylarginine dimethylaminohydrolase